MHRAGCRLRGREVSFTLFPKCPCRMPVDVPGSRCNVWCALFSSCRPAHLATFGFSLQELLLSTAVWRTLNAGSRQRHSVHLHRVWLQHEIGWTHVFYPLLDFWDRSVPLPRGRDKGDPHKSSTSPLGVPLRVVFKPLVFIFCCLTARCSGVCCCRLRLDRGGPLSTIDVSSAAKTNCVDAAAEPILSRLSFRARHQIWRHVSARS
jgi:hypothetical protein